MTDQSLGGERCKDVRLVVMEITCCILPCCPRQPKYEKTCNNCGRRKTNAFFFFLFFLMRDPDVQMLFSLLGVQLYLREG